MTPSKEDLRNEGGDSMNNLADKAGLFIQENNWNALYDCLEEWIKVDEGNSIPEILISICCHFTHPPKLEKAMEMELKGRLSFDEKATVDALSWIKDQPDGACRNILYACTLSLSDAVTESIELLKKEASSRPAPAVYIALGISYSETNDESKYLKKALEIDQDNAFAYYKLGMIDYRSQNYRSAISKLEKAIEKCNEFVMAHVDIAHIYELAGPTYMRRIHLSKAVEYLEDGEYRGLLEIKLKEKEKMISPVMASKVKSMVSSALASGFGLGFVFIFLKIIYGASKGYGFIDNVFSINGLIVFASGFIAGAFMPFNKD